MKIHQHPRRRFSWLIVSSCLASVLGCGPGTPPAANPSAGSVGAAPAPAAVAPAPPAVPNAGETERVAAQAGVGSKGRSLDPHEGILVTPAKTFFTAKERIAFEIAVPHALNLYKALNGEAPKSHEEFMAKIVTENNIQLPKLPDGHRYIYDPATEQLMVERPKSTAAQPSN